MQYPLEEKIGPPELLVGRLDEFTNFNQWLYRIPNRLSKSRVILARRKSGKTSFVQRIFNQLWYQNGKVVPFYFDFADKDIWVQNLSHNYFRAFASQYISFLERDPRIVKSHLTIPEIYDYATSHSHRAMARDAKYLLDSVANNRNEMDTIWALVSSAPHRYASGTEQRFLVILDEFQNIASHVYREPACEGNPDKSMPGSYHSLSESKVAPMLVTGSYPGILMAIMDEYLEAGRLSIYKWQPSLTPDEGQDAVKQYAEFYGVPTTEGRQAQLNELCFSDPFLISCVILNDFPGKDLTTEQGVIDAVNYEITDRSSEMSKTWAEYLRLTFRRVNGMATKKLIWFLNKHDHKDWMPEELKRELNLDLSEDEIYDRLTVLEATDVIKRVESDIEFRGMEDGTLRLVLRHRFEKEIDGVKPDFKTEFQAQLATQQGEIHKWRGRASHYKGLLAERTLAFEFRAKQQTRQALQLTDYFDYVPHSAPHSTPLNLLQVLERVPHQRVDGENRELDILAKADVDEKGNRYVIMVEVRHREKKTGIEPVTKLYENALDYGQQDDVIVLLAYLSLSGFTEEAKTFCLDNGIGMAEKVHRASY